MNEKKENEGNREREKKEKNTFLVGYLLFILAENAAHIWLSYD